MNVVALTPEPSFDRFWHYFKALDRNVDRRECKELYDGITNGGAEVTIIQKDGTRKTYTLKATPGEIIQGAKFYFDRMLRTKTEARFIRTPAVWLRHAGWEDEL